MKKENISKAIGNMNSKYIIEAENYSASAKKAFGNKSFPLKTFIAACLVICLVVGTVAYAVNEIREWSSSITFEDGTRVDIVENAAFKSIPDTAPKTGRTENELQVIRMTHAEVEEALGFHILNYENATSDSLGYQTHLNKDGSIGRIDLWWAEFLKINENKHMTLSIFMLNQNADEGYVLAFNEGIDAAGGKKLENIVTINSLGTKIIVYKSDSHDNKISITLCYRISNINQSITEIL